MLVDRLLRVALAGSSWVLYLLIALSVVSFGAMVERFLFFWRHRDDFTGLRTRIGKALAAGDHVRAKKLLESSPSLAARAARGALEWEHGGPSALADALESELGVLRTELERGTNLLGTLGNNAPFVGLFGTVLGVIEAFHQLSGGPAKAGMGNVMSGIAEALVATGVGLFVALPAVVAYNLVQKRVGDVENDAQILGKLFAAELRVRERDEERGRSSSKRETTSQTESTPDHETAAIAPRDAVSVAVGAE
ncbi:MAG: MotA/TolQ/ExbB proton channel family protein [Polyangiaceae bacterium]|nr:MotA/TolQ/ExbB proton channel family protein [Polyangiaceae bacterium]